MRSTVNLCVAFMTAFLAAPSFAGENSATSETRPLPSINELEGSGTKTRSAIAMPAR
jgi:hypothetical protein